MGIHSSPHKTEHMRPQQSHRTSPVRVTRSVVIADFKMPALSPVLWSFGVPVLTSADTRAPARTMGNSASEAGFEQSNDVNALESLPRRQQEQEHWNRSGAWRRAGPIR